MLGHPHRWPPAAVGAGEHHLGGQPVVALAEHRRAHREGLADGRLGGLSTEVDHGHDVHDGDASDHVSNLARSRRRSARSQQVQGRLSHRGTQPHQRPGCRWARSGRGDGWARPHVAPTRAPPQRDEPGCVMRRPTWDDWFRAIPTRAQGWNVPRTRANVCGCVPSDDSPSAPCCPRRSPPSASSPQPALVLAPADPGPLRRGRPRAVGGDRARPGPAARRGGAGAPRRAGRRRRVPASGSARSTRDLRRYLTERPLVPAHASAATGPRRGDRATSHPSSASPRCCRSTPAASASSPATTSRRPATSASRSIGVGLLYRHGYFRQSLSREGWQQETYPVLDPDGLPITLLREADGTRATGSSIALPDGRAADRAGSGWPGSAASRCCCSTPTWRTTPSTYVDVTDRLYGGNSEHRLRQEMLLGIGGVRALRAFSRLTGAPGPRGLPHQRGPRRLPRPGAHPRAHRGRGRPGLDFDTALEVGRAGTVFTTHTPVPAGIDRFPRDAGRSSTSARTAPRPACRSSGCSPSAARTTPGGDPTVFNMAVMGFRLAQRANGVSRLHGQVSREMFDGLWPAFDEAEVPDRLDHQRRARTDLGGPRDLRPRRRAGRRHADPDDVERLLGGRSTRCPARRSGRSSGCCASGWSTTPAAGCASPGASAAPPRPSWLDRRRPSTPTC